MHKYTFNETRTSKLCSDLMLLCLTKEEIHYCQRNQIERFEANIVKAIFIATNHFNTKIYQMYTFNYYCYYCSRVWLHIWKNKQILQLRYFLSRKIMQQYIKWRMNADLQIECPIVCPSSCTKNTTCIQNDYLSNYKCISWIC